MKKVRDPLIYFQLFHLYDFFRRHVVKKSNHCAMIRIPLVVYGVVIRTRNAGTRRCIPGNNLFTPRGIHGIAKDVVMNIIGNVFR